MAGRGYLHLCGGGGRASPPIQDDLAKRNRALHRPRLAPSMRLRRSVGKRQAEDEDRRGSLPGFAREAIYVRSAGHGQMISEFLSNIRFDLNLNLAHNLNRFMVSESKRSALQLPCSSPIESHGPTRSLKIPQPPSRPWTATKTPVAGLPESL